MSKVDMKCENGKEKDRERERGREGKEAKKPRDRTKRARHGLLDLRAVQDT